MAQDQTTLFQKSLLAVIRAYQWGFSPLLGAHCRYEPSCSEYTCQSVRLYGVIKGLWMGFRRILRCHPFCSGGFDPVVIRHARRDPRS
ncbi:membrane protein insertion efficiency factor YidD [PVC group bacterium]|nr:membrane protein insertion efficiency factor YidD [PVC group bacterium]